MDINTLIEKHRMSKELNVKAIFASLFIIQNKLQTTFDKSDPEITLKQFLLLIMVKQSDEQLTLTQLGVLLGCSRQNVKKLAVSLEKKGFIRIIKTKEDIRGLTVESTGKLAHYFNKIEEKHGEMLALLFRDYSEAEITQLFQLLVKLYGGLERIEEYVKKHQ